jgi:hypothetical protein
MWFNRVKTYRGDMAASTTLHPIRGSTAIGPDHAPESGRDHPRHLIGSAMRAIGVFADTVFRVVVLGADAADAARQPDNPHIPAARDGADRS